jgi:hypothetical protein
MMRKMKAFVLICSLAITSHPLSAQILYEPIFSPADMMANHNIKFNPIVNNTIERGRNNNSSTESYSQQEAPQTTSLTYTPSKSRTRTNLQNFVNKSRAADPAGAAQMEQMFASTDVIGQIGDAMASVGLSRSNAADAFALYWVSAWQAANGRSDTRSPETYKAAAAQAARGLSQSPEFAAATEAQKQEMAEALMVQAALIDAAADQAAGADPQQASAFRKAVSQGAAASGLELDKMTLTEEGFV